MCLRISIHSFHIRSRCNPAKRNFPRRSAIRVHAYLIFIVLWMLRAWRDTPGDKRSIREKRGAQSDWKNIDLSRMRVDETRRLLHIQNDHRIRTRSDNTWILEYRFATWIPGPLQRTCLPLRNRSIAFAFGQVNTTREDALCRVLIAFVTDNACHWQWLTRIFQLR